LSDNTNAIFHITVQTPDKSLEYRGSTTIDGVLGSGSPIAVKTLNPAGLTCGSMLPTKKVADTLTLESGQ
jgi:2-methylaconitate cis-trans-isomerase PrpF